MTTPAIKKLYEYYAKHGWKIDEVIVFDVSPEKLWRDYVFWNEYRLHGCGD